MKKLKVADSKSLYRDDETGAIINSDKEGYNKYMAQKVYREDQKVELDNLRSELDELKRLINKIT